MRRLRRDTKVILHLKKRMLAELFDDPTLKIAFQNRLLIYLLYKCGGFVPTCTEIPALVKIHSIPDAHVVKRHGTDVNKNLESVLSDGLMAEVTNHFGGKSRRPQSQAVQWPGGYFGFPGSQAAAKTLGDEVRREWREEYLPGPTALAALSLCTAVAGLLLRDHKPDKRKPSAWAAWTRRAAGR